MRHPVQSRSLTMGYEARDSGQNNRKALWRAVLQCISSNRTLNKRLVLRGAAALHLIYGGLRFTRDLDFLILRNESWGPKPVEPWYTQSLLDRAIAAGLQEHMKYKTDIESVRSELKIELAPCDERIDCAVQRFDHASDAAVLACTLNDIIASKLLAVLRPYLDSQRRREVDLYDLADIWLRMPQRVDCDRVARLFSAKAKRFQMNLQLGLFDDSIRCRLRHSYDEIQVGGGAAIAFADAWSAVLDVVGRCSASTLS